MGIFTRRVLQRCLEESVKYASRQKIRRWVRALNNSTEPNYAATEWEVVVLNALSKVATVEHPAETSMQATLDCIVTALDGQLRFAADVTAVSDRGLHAANPIYELQQQLERRYRSAKLSKGGLRLRVEEAPFIGTRGHRRRLLLPKVQEFDTLIFNDHFSNFLEAARANPDRESVYTVSLVNPRTSLSVFYDPRVRGAGLTSYAAYCSTNVIDKIHSIIHLWIRVNR